MKFHYLARGIVFKNGKVLLAHQMGASNTFLPGGHIEMCEKAEVALLREIAEELGENAVVIRFIGAVESRFTEFDQIHHEINLLFEVDIPNLDAMQSPASKEPHLEFFWAKPVDLSLHNLLPYPIIECLMNWEKGYCGYWGSSF